MSAGGKENLVQSVNLNFGYLPLTSVNEGMSKRKGQGFHTLTLN